MFSRLGLTTTRLFTRNSGVSRAYHPPADFKPPSMNDLPVPQGSWQAHHDAKQRKYNAQLIGGVGFLIFSLIVAKSSGLFYLNWAPPELKKE